ncbi:putative ribonuclease H-like domain-containing protein [Tanacetum coccineum]
MMRHQTMKMHQTLKKEEYDIWAMEMEHYLEYIDNEVWKVIQNGNSKKRISTGKDGIVRVLSTVNAERFKLLKKERKDKNILMNGHSQNKHMRRFNGMDVKKRYGSTSRTRFGVLALLLLLQPIFLKKKFLLFCDEGMYIKGEHDGKKKRDSTLSTSEAGKQEKNRWIVTIMKRKWQGKLRLRGLLILVIGWKNQSGQKLTGPNINTGRTNINSGRPKVNAVSSNVNTVRSRQPEHPSAEHDTLSVLGKFDGKSDEGFLVGASEVTNSAGTSQTPSFNASEEKDEDVELIVVPSTVRNTEEKAESRKSSTNSKKEEILTELQQETKVSSTNTLEDNPKIQAFRRDEPVNTGSFDPDDSPMPELEIFHKSETGIFDEASYDEEGVITDFNSLPTELIQLCPKPEAKGKQNKELVLSQEEPKKIAETLQNDSWVQAMQEELLQFNLQQVWVLVDLPHGMKEEGIDYDEVFASVARIEAIRLFLAFASFIGLIVYQMDVKSAFLYGTIDEEVYVLQPPGFIDPDNHTSFIKVVKALYGLHQAPRSCMLPLSTFLEKAWIQEGLTLTDFIHKRTKSLKPEEKHITDEFRGELTFFLGYNFNNTWRPRCLWTKVTPKTSHLNDVKRIFKYLKGKPNLGLWYPRESPFDLEAFSDSDYGGSNLDRKSTTGFAEIVDFLRGSNLRYALTSNPTIYDSLVKQFWQTATTNTKADGTLEINATIDTMIFGNMKRGFRGAPRPLLPAMLLVATTNPNAVHSSNTLTPATIPTPTPIPETEPAPFEHTFEEPSLSTNTFTPQDQAAQGTNALDDLLQVVPQLISRIDSLETDLKQTKLTMGNAIVKEESQDDPLDSLVQGLVTPSTTKVNASGEEQVEDISPNTLEAAKTLSRVASLKPKSIDKGRRYKRRKRDKGSSIKLSTVSEKVSTGSAKREGKAALLKTIQIGMLYIRRAQVQFEAQHYTDEDWDLIRAKIEANAELSKSMLGSDLQGEDFAKKMVDLVNQRKKYFAEERAELNEISHDPITAEDI